MSRLLIEWKHFDKDGATCKRCSQTGGNLSKIITQIKCEFIAKGIEIQLHEIKLPESKIS